MDILTFFFGINCDQRSSINLLSNIISFINKILKDYDKSKHQTIS